MLTLLLFVGTLKLTFDAATVTGLVETLLLDEELLLFVWLDDEFPLLPLLLLLLGCGFDDGCDDATGGFSVLFFFDPGVTKSPIQLPKTFTTVTISFPPVLILLFAKLTRLAIICASPVLIVLFPPVLLLASFPPVFADRFVMQSLSCRSFRNPQLS